MPELYDVPDMDKHDFFYSYVETYLSKDVKEQLNILDTNIFKDFMVSVASRNGEQLNYTNLASEIGISDKTYLTGWYDARNLQLSEKSGHYLETYVISDIIKSYNSIGIEPKISYYRDKDKNEIDLIIEKNNK